MGNRVSTSNGKTEQLCDREGSSEASVESGRNGSCSCIPHLPSCVFYSPRIEGLLRGLLYGTIRTGDVESMIESTKDHWTEVDPRSEAEAEILAEDNRKYFDEVLVKHPQWGEFFGKFEDLQVGDKIGEGGQAEIFRATSQSYRSMGHEAGLVAKVWKEGISLKDLERQWPPQMLPTITEGGYSATPFHNLYGGTFIRDGEFKHRFAFIMGEWSCDLRTHIDLRMLRLLVKSSHCPPFSNIGDVYYFAERIAFDLHVMHHVGVLHRDIKASNVLVSYQNDEDAHLPVVIDYECSVGVSGTGFWRAPEILEQLQKRVPSHELVYTAKADIYSFGMLCYEMVTGRIPFEGHPVNDYSIVLRGERPELPLDLDPMFKELILDCWQHDPKLRPTFYDIMSRVCHLSLLLK